MAQFCGVRMFEVYDKDYFENGILTKKSCYEHYRWMPELTYPLAYSVVKYLELKASDNIFEFGCAHGFMVKALRDFNINAYGVDISEFAIQNCPKDITKFVAKIDNDNTLRNVLNDFGVSFFEFGISKDVFEHIPKPELELVLREMSQLVRKLFVVVPLGDEGVYRIPSYHLDPTHVIAENEEWWKSVFSLNGFRLIDFQYKVDGIKDRWQLASPVGNGFFLLESLVK